MLEKNVDLGNHLPRSLNEVDIQNIDLIVNHERVRDSRAAEPWTGWSPIRIGGPIEGYRSARDKIELNVMNLISAK